MSSSPPAADLSAPDAHLREHTIESKQVYRGDFLDVRRDTVRLPDGGVSHREYIVHPGAVMVVAMLEDGRLLVERQWRYPIGRAMLEFPAGKIEPGEPVLDCAIRELTEETGYRAAEWARAGLFHNAIGYSNEGIEIWFARGLVAGVRQLDAGEFLDVCSIGADELEALVRAGQVSDGKTLVGLQWFQTWRAGRWPVEWRAAPEKA